MSAFYDSVCHLNTGKTFFLAFKDLKSPAADFKCRKTALERQ